MVASRMLRSGDDRSGRTIAEPGPDSTAPRRRAVRPVVASGLAVAVVLALVSALALPGGSALAQTSAAGQGAAGTADDAYTARAVPIEAEAADAAQARDKAIAAGRVAAFQVLLERITDPGERASLPQPSAETVRDIVDTYSLANERTTATTYKADMTVRFNGAAVRQLLNQRGVSHAAGSSQPVIVVPVYRPARAAEPLLWEDTNPWLMAWRAQEGENILMPLEVPTGDLADVTTITGRQALSGDSAALGSLLQRHGRAQVLVAQAVRTGADTLDVSLQYGSPNAMATLSPQTVTRQPGEGEEAWLSRAARDLASRMEGDWRSATMVRSGSAQTETALVTLGSFQDWIAIRSALERSPLIRDMQVQAISRDMAQVRLTVMGDVARVGAALQSEGLSLSVRGGYWMIARAGSGGMPAGYGSGAAAGAGAGADLGSGGGAYGTGGGSVRP